MRGKGPDCRFLVFSVGITPACAGKSMREVGVYQAGVGSPPRVRGKDFQGTVTPPYSGITPACAGKSWAMGQIESGKEDHPRVCGEKLKTEYI